MAKNKGRGRMGNASSGSPIGPHFPYVNKLWADYSEQEIRGMGFGRGKRSQKNSSLVLLWVILIVIVFPIVVFLLALLGVL